MDNSEWDVALLLPVLRIRSNDSSLPGHSSLSYCTAVPYIYIYIYMLGGAI